MTSRAGSRPIKLSIAMTTYNGASYLGEQLDSIFEQSRLPNELVACDDRSTDETSAILRQYARRAPFPMKVVVNDERLGSTRNFEKAIGLCSGDVIALCDQDDVWRPKKLAVIESAFDTDPGLGVVLTNAALINELGRILRRDLWSGCRLSPRRQKALGSSRRYDLLLGLPVATGATMAFRSQFRSLVLPIPTDCPTFIHDRWIAVLIAAVARMAIIPEKLIDYRLHGQQQLGVAKVPLVLRPFLAHPCRSDTVALAALEQRLKQRPCWSANQDFWRSLHQRHRHVAERAEFSPNPFRRMQQIASEFRSGRYGLYPFGTVVPLQDLLAGTR